MDLSGMTDFGITPKQPIKTVTEKATYYMTMTENVQLMTDGTSDDTNLLTNNVGNSNWVWCRLLDGLQKGDRFVSSQVFWLYADVVFQSILAALGRGVICIGITAAETQFSGSGGFNMQSPGQTKQRLAFIAAGGYTFPLHFTSFCTDGTEYPWIGNSAYGGSLNHSKLLCFDSAANPAIYLGSQNPEFDDEDMGITIENAPLLLQEGLVLLNRFIWCSFLQNASTLMPLSQKSAFMDSESNPASFVSYNTPGLAAYLPGCNKNSTLPKILQSWSGISSNLSASLAAVGITQASVAADPNLGSVHFTADTGIFPTFGLVSTFSEYNRLQVSLADYSNYQNYSLLRPKISELYSPDQTWSAYYGQSSTVSCYLGIGPPQLTGADAGTTYDLVAICKTINGAQFSLDIANMNPDGSNNFVIVWDAIKAAVLRGVHVRIMTDKDQSGYQSVQQLQQDAIAQSGCKGTLAVRIWDQEKKYSYYCKHDGVSAYHCKYILSEFRVYLGNQNLLAEFYAGMGGVCMILENCAVVRDQLLNYYNRDWESPWMYDLPVGTWGVCPAGAVSLDPCFQYGPYQNGRMTDSSAVPADCKARADNPWRDQGSYYRAADGGYLGTCLSGIPISANGACLPANPFLALTASCALAETNPDYPYQIPKKFGAGICQPASVACSSSQAAAVTYQLVISIPPDMTYPPTGPILPDTLTEWGKATDNAKTLIDCVFIYSNLGLQSAFLQKLLSAAKRGVRIRLIFALPPNAYGQETEKELQALLAFPSVETYYTTYPILFASDPSSFPFISPDQGPSDGILHTKLYIWDDTVGYVGAQNQEEPIAVEVGFMLSGNPCLVQDLRKIVDYYVLGSCMQCRTLGISTLQPEQLGSLQSSWNQTSPYSVLMTDRTSGKSFGADTYVSVSPARSAELLGRTSDLNAIADVFGRAKKFIYVATMDFSNSTDFYESFSYNWGTVSSTLVPNVQFPTLFNLIAAAVKAGITVKLLIGLRREFGQAGAQPCGYKPYNINAVKMLENQVNTGAAGTGSLNAKFLRFGLDPATGYYEGIFHSKFIITDQSVLMTTNNLTGDYFISTAGVSVCCHLSPSNTSTDLPMQNDLLNFYSSLWNSSMALTTDAIICSCDQNNFCSAGKPIVLTPQIPISSCFGSRIMNSNGQCVASANPTGTGTGTGGGGGNTGTGTGTGGGNSGTGTGGGSNSATGTGTGTGGSTNQVYHYKSNENIWGIVGAAVLIGVVVLTGIILIFISQSKR